MQHVFSYSQIEPKPSRMYKFSMELRLNIRTLRKAKGWTLEQLATKIRVSVPHLSEVERGVKNLNNHLMTRLAEALEVEPRELFSSGAIADDSEAEDANELIAEVLYLDGQDRRRVWEFINALRLSSSNSEPVE